jgi:hypothetical protein
MLANTSAFGPPTPLELAFPSLASFLSDNGMIKPVIAAKDETLKRVILYLEKCLNRAPISRRLSKRTIVIGQ